ncbi:MAG: putative ABC transporter permease [Clostridiales bacterium]|nr:putative ABC transporter permease [Clostridiales bacterium]
MFTYNILQWTLFFYIYCFLGWIIESTIVSFSEKRIVNRGFLKGPFLPIYGSGALIILFVTLPFRNNYLLIFLLGMIFATILEYFTSWLMDKILTMKYWDYSNEKFNLNGRICLKCSLFWGVLSLFLTLVIHTPIEKYVLNFNYTKITVIILSLYFVIDFSYSIYNVINLNKLLAVLDGIKNEIESTYEEIKESSFISSKHEYDVLKNKLEKLKKSYIAATSKINYFHIHIIKTYPKAKSRKFNSSLRDLKDKIFKKVATYKKGDVEK